MLLQGPVGVRKTFTAESVAEEMKCLLPGPTVDERDVFLQERSSASMSQNQLVAVFLRPLKYYRGVLLLTTNRVKALDPAFESRIHLMINYPPLNATSRHKIWQNFIQGPDDAMSDGTEPAITTGDVKGLARLDLSGREIKDVVKTARLLAAKEEYARNLSSSLPCCA
ncbi:hypothetical protein DL770_000647 [Monosporascus sp. CRB-9-2]|nr:hypothetical protein DL770_000647 [Monosporascus sp. CRB-9-2]